MQLLISKIVTKENYDQVILQLWESVLGAIWPVDRLVLTETVFSPDSVNFVAKDGADIVGFLSAQVIGEKASVICVLVEQSYQRRGIGTKLVMEALDYFRLNRVKLLTLGSDGSSYFWPGIPTNLEPALMFFKKLSWNYSEISVDMIGQLKNYQTPYHLGYNVWREYQMATINAI